MYDAIVQWVIQLLTSLAAGNPLAHLVLTILGVLVAAGQAVVLITPTTADDVAWAKIKALPVIGPIIAMLANFAPWHKS